MNKPIREYEPVPEKVMEELSPLNTICNDLREIYRKSDQEEVRILARIATAKAKAMIKKLHEYNKNSSKELFRPRRKIRLFSLGLCYGEEIDIFIHHIVTRLSYFDAWEVYGFEANKSHYENICKKYNGNLYMNFFHRAICNQTGPIKLYYADDPHGHSIYKGKRNVISPSKFELVESIRFSSWLFENFRDLETSFNILNFNIEGAEIDLFRDMDENDCFHFFDLFCGDAHDLPKCMETKDTVGEFRVICDKHNIDTQPFNYKKKDFTFNRILTKLKECEKK